MKHLDLFSGIGGFALAARWAGIETVAFCEIDQFCQKVLKKNWPDVFIFDDVKTLHHFQHVDILTAGFPCQPFSVAGKQRGKDDDRYLWPEVIRIIREVKPNWCILENVPGIIPHLDTILEDLENEGYDWRAFLIPASAVGAPHKRERLWIIANANSQQCNKREIYQDAESERLERTKLARAFGFTPSNALQFSDTQTDQAVDSKRSSGHSWSVNGRKHRSCLPKFNWQENKPPIPGVDDGIPNGLDRNKALGNAIVPQIPYLFMKFILGLQDEI